MKPLNPKAQQILDAVPTDRWIDVIDLHEACGLSWGNYYSFIATLSRRGLVERNADGAYRRTQP